MTEKYSKNFEKAFEYLMQNEGEYVNDPNDPGGETKYGISKRSYPSLDIRNLTVEKAKEIYYRDFWMKGKFDQILDCTLAVQLFDFSVNLGIKVGIRLLQRAIRAGGINIQDDGIFGPMTLSCVKNSEPKVLLAAIKSEAAGYYRWLVAKNPRLQKFLNGWLNRAYRKIGMEV